MKTIFLFVIILLNTFAFAQVGINTTTPNATFEIAATSTSSPSNTDGLLVPRVNTFPVTNPTADQQGMLVYLTTTVGINLRGFYHWDNPATKWIAMASSGTSTSWELLGNTVNGTTDFLGSTNNADVVFKRNGIESGRIADTNTSYGVSSLIANTTGNNGTAIGFQSLYNNTTGTSNTANGAQALHFNTNGVGNTAIGRVALYNNTTGNFNTAVGRNAMYSSTIGSYNTSNGHQALFKNTIGNYNVGSGSQALNDNLTGNDNTANGYQSLFRNTIGNKNTANGYQALFGNSAGNSNTGVGYKADVTSGLNNATAIGSNAMATTSNSIVLGSVNGTNGATANVNVGMGTTAPTERLHIDGKIRIVDGTQATGKVLTSDANGVASWQTGAPSNAWSLTGNTVNSASDFLGSTNDADVIFKRNNIQAGRINNTNTSYGLAALNPNTTGYFNIAIGTQALYNNTSGVSNIANGFQSLYFNSSGGQNTANGHQSLYSNTTGLYNTANGFQSLYSNSSGGYNTANGYKTLYFNTTGNFNIASGGNSLYSNTIGNYNIASGMNSLLNNTTGNQNVATGRAALYSNTIGNDNVASGASALVSNTTGSHNSATGTNSLYSNSVGSQNTATGYNSLYNNREGQNTAIGFRAGFNLTNGNNNVFIGANTEAYSNTVSNYININNQLYGNNGNIGIGSTNPTRAKLVINGSVNTNNGPYGYLNNAGATGTNNSTNTNPTSIWASGRVISSEFNATSDNRIKQNVIPVQNALITLSKLNIVNYTKLSKDGVSNEIGVIAQELEKIMPQAVKHGEGDIYNANTKLWEVVQDFRTVNYQTINMLTAKAVQELELQLKIKNDEVQELKEQYKILELRLKKIESLLKI